MKSTYRFIICGAIAVAALIAQSTRKPAFVSAEQLYVVPFLADPPAAGSAALAAEMAELHRLQDTRTPAQVARAKSDDAEEDIFVYRDAVGERFTREALPLTAAFGDRVHNDEGIVVNPAKTFFHRPRPYQFDTTLQPVCKATTNTADYAYPSGHGTTGYLEALVVSMMVPEKRAAILARADDYAHNRLVCGVHYPTDVVASKQVAYAMMGVMLSNPQFKKELETARAETRAKLGL